jgi:hypothetical protein
MTQITFQDGKVVFRDGAVGTEQACCCKKCSGPCEGDEDCAPGCVCVDGECVECNCVVFASQQIDYCTQVDGEWQYCSLGQCVPCECGEGWTTTILQEGVLPWGEAYRVVGCSYSSDADYETCCSPDAPRDEFGALADCEAYDAMIASNNTNFILDEAFVGCFSDNPLP